MEDDGRLLARNELQFKDGKVLPVDYKKNLREPSPEERQRNSTSLQLARPTDCSLRPNPRTEHPKPRKPQPPVYNFILGGSTIEHFGFLVFKEFQ